MVIDRLQLFIFFIVTTAGTVGIIMDAPHIFDYVDQDKIIEIYRGKWIKVPKKTEKKVIKSLLLLNQIIIKLNFKKWKKKTIIIFLIVFYY